MSHWWAGAKESAQAITTTTGGWTCSSLSGATTYCYTTMVTGPLLTSQGNLDCGMTICAGAPDAPSSTMTVTAAWTCSSPSTSILIPQRRPFRGRAVSAVGRGFLSCAAAAVRSEQETNATTVPARG